MSEPPSTARPETLARAQNPNEFARLAEPYRRELQAHCYRMLGSLLDAEDLVQETLLRAWKNLRTYEGRASFRTWLYKIATNACLDALARRPKRALPTTNFPPANPNAPPAPPILEPIWLEPFPDELVANAETNPEARYDARESITLAFLTALQILPPRQRAVLILRDVLDWEAREAAKTLGLTVSAVNSALHRARVTMAKHYRATFEAIAATPDDEKTRGLLDRYVRAWEDADVDALVALLKEDATFPMPPTPSWYRGREAIRILIETAILNGEARARYRLIPTRANGTRAFGLYQRDARAPVYRPFAIQVVTFEQDMIADITTFPNPALFPFFNLPVQVGT